MLKVQLFGHFSASFDGTPLTSLHTPRQQALFSCLILNPNTPQLRGRLACQFWPESSDSQARTNLRNLVHLLRQGLPDFDSYIRLNPQALQWREDSAYTLDVCEFRQLLAIHPGGGLVREHLERAVALYRGDLLPECYDDWIVPEREGLHRAFLAALEALAEIAENSREYPAALEYTRRQLQEEPLDPAANRRHIRLQSIMDNCPAALRSYKVYARTLDREFGIQPDQELQELYSHLKVQTGLKSRKLPTSTQGILVGRQPEWNRLQAAWRMSAAGSTQAVFVTGEAGIGKTRLLEELVVWASRQGIQTAVASCYPAEGSLPFAPVASWLKTLPLPLLEDVWLKEIARFLPGIIKSNPKLAPPRPLTESWQRLRLFEALARAITGNRRKLLLVIEDIHWCDPDTLEWIHYLHRFDDRMPILIVATERSDEVTVPEHPLKTLKTSLASTGRFIEIRLSPLDEAESFQLASQVAEQYANQSLNHGDRSHIFHETEGNPLYVVEMVRLGAPLLSPEMHTGALIPLSEKVQAIINQRISHLTPQTRELVSLAATIGREFRLDVLLHASNLEEAILVNSINELVQRQIVHEQDGENFDFTHDKLRQAVFAGLSSAHRRLLHRKVAEAYLQLDETAPRRRDAEIANHYERAGLVLSALQYYRMASESAAGVFSNNEAVHWLKHAIGLLEDTQAGNKISGPYAQTLAEMLVRLGDILMLTGQSISAQQAYERALGQIFDQERVWRSMVYRKISETQVLQQQHDLAYDSLDLAEQALHFKSEAGILEVQQEWISIQFGRAQLMYWDNRPEEMGTILEEIHPVVESHGRIDQQIDALSLEYQLRLRREKYRLSADTVDLAYRRFKRCSAAGNPYNTCYATFQYGFALLWHSEILLAQIKLAEAMKLAEDIGARTVQARCLSYLSIATRKLGQVEALSNQTSRLLELSVALGEPNYQGVACANQAWLAWMEGHFDEAAEYGQSAMNCWHKFPGSYVFMWLALWPLLAIAVRSQRLDEIQIRVQQLLDPEQQPLLPPIAKCLADGIQACQARDETRALAFFRQALEKAQESGDL